MFFVLRLFAYERTGQISLPKCILKHRRAHRKRLRCAYFFNRAFSSPPLGFFFITIKKTKLTDTKEQHTKASLRRRDSSHQFGRQKFPSSPAASPPPPPPAATQNASIHSDLNCSLRQVLIFYLCDCLVLCQELSVSQSTPPPTPSLLRYNYTARAICENRGRSSFRPLVVEFLVSPILANRKNEQSAQFLRGCNEYS